MLQPLRATTRSYVSQEVLVQLARAIIAGAYPADDALPSERVLAEQLGVSRVLIRNAIHRLAEVGLVTVRQGAPTQVKALDDAPSLPLVELIYRIGDELPGNYASFMIERQYLNGLSLMDLAERRGNAAQFQKIIEWIDTQAPVDQGSFQEFEQQFWIRIAQVTRNSIFIGELKWWYRLVGDRMPRPESVIQTPLPVRIVFHRELVRRLRDDEDGPAYYMSVVGPLIDSL